MTVKIPSSLKWLVNRHVRLTSDIKRLARQLLIHEELYQQLLWDNRRAEEASVRNLHCRRTQLDQLKADLKIIDSTLLLHDIPINPERIASVNTQTAIRRFRFGDLTRLIYLCLKHANRSYPSTSEITAFAITHLERAISEDEQKIIREAIAKRLRKLRADGKVTEVPQAKTVFDKRWELSNWTALSTMGRPKKIKSSIAPSHDDGLDDSHATNGIIHF